MKQFAKLALTLPGESKQTLCRVTKPAMRLLGLRQVADILLCTNEPRAILSVKEVMGKDDSVGFSALFKKSEKIPASQITIREKVKFQRITILADPIARDNCKFLEVLTLTSGRNDTLIDTSVVQRTAGGGRIYDDRSFGPDELVMVELAPPQDDTIPGIINF
ncbi:MAG: hypothetical protein WC793_02875 [Candidatus Paceibacterota bacterium]|jgi:hypothetical protein